MEQKDVHWKKLLRLRDWIRVKVVVLSILIVIVWGLLILPIVFYHIPVEVANEVVRSKVIFKTIANNCVLLGFYFVVS